MEARLPVPFARTGGFADFFVVAQWFPKLGVFETAGVQGSVTDRWNAHQFHGPTEFYADYADYDVRIGVPVGWTVAATGWEAATIQPWGERWRKAEARLLTGLRLLALALAYGPDIPAAALAPLYNSRL